MKRQLNHVKKIRGFLFSSAIALAGMMGQAAAQTNTNVICTPSTSTGLSAQPNYQSICWIDFSALSTSALATGQAFLVNLADGSQLRFTVQAPTSSASWTSVAAPSWNGAAIGASSGSYSGMTGKTVVRYTAGSGTPGTLNINNISMTDALGAPSTNFYFVVADGESTNAANATSFETWQATINASASGTAKWEQFDQVPNTAGVNPTNSVPGGTGVGPTQTGVGTTTVKHTGVNATNAGSYIYRVKAPTSLTLNTTSPYNGMQGIMLAVQVSVVNLNKVIQPSRVKATDQFTYTATGAKTSYTSSQTTSGTALNGFGTVTLSQLSGLNTISLLETVSTTSTATLADYAATYTCSNINPVNTITMPSGTGTSFSLSPQPGDVITCTFTNTRKSQEFNVRKVWAGGAPNGNTASVTTSGTSSASSFTSTSPNATTGNTVKVYVGEQVTLPLETLNVGSSIATYSTTIQCTGGTPLAETSMTAAQQITITNSTPPTTCTYTNTLKKPNITLSKFVRKLPSGGFGVSGNGLPGELLQYCVAFRNTGDAAALNFRLSDAFPQQTRAANPTATTDAARWNLVYSAATVSAAQTSAPAPAALPAGTTYTVGNVATSTGTTPGVILDMGAAGLPVGGSGTICFDAAIQ